jgi:gas vesicle protein
MPPDKAFLTGLFTGAAACAAAALLLEYLSIRETAITSRASRARSDRIFHKPALWTEECSFRG